MPKLIKKVSGSFLRIQLSPNIFTCSFYIKWNQMKVFVRKCIFTSELRQPQYTEAKWSSRKNRQNSEDWHQPKNICSRILIKFEGWFHRLSFDYEEKQLIKTNLIFLFSQSEIEIIIFSRDLLRLVLAKTRSRFFLRTTTQRRFQASPAKISSH